MIEFLELRNVSHHSELDEGIQQGIRGCVDSAFGGTITEEDALEHMCGDQLLLVRDEDSVIAFSSTSVRSLREVTKHEGFDEEPALYFAAAAVSRTAQSRGLYKEMNARRVTLLDEEGVDTSVIFTRTQNPRVQHGIGKAITSYIDSGVSTYQGFRFERILFRGYYGRMLTKDKPKARQVSYDDELDTANGDAYILKWELTTDVEDYLMKGE